MRRSTVRVLDCIRSTGSVKQPALFNVEALFPPGDCIIIIQRVEYISLFNMWSYIRSVSYVKYKCKCYKCNCIYNAPKSQHSRDRGADDIPSWSTSQVLASVCVQVKMTHEGGTMR